MLCWLRKAIIPHSGFLNIFLGTSRDNLNKTKITFCPFWVISLQTRRNYRLKEAAKSPKGITSTEHQKNPLLIGRTNDLEI